MHFTSWPVVFTAHSTSLEEAGSIMINDNLEKAAIIVINGNLEEAAIIIINDNWGGSSCG